MPSVLFRCLAGAAVILSPAAAHAADPFTGTWKGELSSVAIQGKPDAYVLQGGMFDCTSCTPAYRIAADGAFYPVKGKDYWDDTAVTVIDDHTIRQQFRKNGKVVSSYTETVSPDGRTATFKVMDSNNGSGTPIEAVSTSTRLSRGPAGSHLISGTWKQVPATSVSDAALTMNMEVTGDTLVMRSGTGETLTARFGGPYAPFVGDPGKTMTKVVRLAPDTIQTTDMRGGKVVGTTTYRVSADGRTLMGKWTDTVSGQTVTFRANKQ